ncbi:V-type ATP synthase subunit F [Thiocystis violacea]|uniref:V-type ATP synthase subunit F n=1 Tax=Thiocystis violacea TaxID=13725 RepID=UPI00190669F2|nr:V-type ATP synthase subunit F [Thiocystis violacea]MBK1719618.1 hypothetical protein [Thiocystis violacea]
MALCAFLGDALTGAGFRLAGVWVQQPRPQEMPALFERLASRAGPSGEPRVELILMTAEVAESLPPARLREVQRQGWPLVLVIPDARRRYPVPDLVSSLRRQLGLAE